MDAILAGSFRAAIYCRYSYIAAFTYGVSLGESIPQCMARGKALATRIVQQFEPYLI